MILHCKVGKWSELGNLKMVRQLYINFAEIVSSSFERSTTSTAEVLNRLYDDTLMIQKPFPKFGIDPL